VIVGGKAVQSIERLDRLGAGGQVVGGIVLLGVLELAGERADRDQDHQPDGDHGELGAAAPWQLGERAGP
jgi:hypothetical protein